MIRRDFLACSAAIVLSAPSPRAAGDPKVLKFVPLADIALLDPHYAPALVTRNHAYLVYDTLYGVDDAARPHPQMAAGHVIEDDDIAFGEFDGVAICEFPNNTAAAACSMSAAATGGFSRFETMTLLTAMEAEAAMTQANKTKTEYKPPHA